jgi:fumarate reductase subunit D
VGRLSPRSHAFCNPAGKVFLLAVIALFLFHGCHRMVYSPHDLGVRTGVRAQIAFYGFAAFGSPISLALLLHTWF